MALSLNDQFGGARQKAQQGIEDTERQIAGQKRQIAQWNPITGFASRDVEQARLDNSQKMQNQAARQSAELAARATDPGRNPFAAFQRNIGTSENFYNEFQ